MNNSVKLLILILISLSIIIVVSDSNIYKSYSINQATIDIFIENYTDLHVEESFLYSFKGTYNGVFRDIPLKPGEYLENINVRAEGAYSEYEIIQDPYEEGKDLVQIKIYLYSDAAKTKPITDENVTIFIDYDFKNVVNLNDENGNLVYNLWGDQWKIPIGELNAAIHLNSRNNTNYTFNNQNYVKKIYWDKTTLRIESTSIPANTYFQINMTFPLDNNVINNYDIYNNENDDNPMVVESSRENEGDFTNFLQILSGNYFQNETPKEINYFLSIWDIIVIATLIIPLATYIKFEALNFNYKKKFKIKALSTDSPAIINSLFGKGFRKNVGEPNIEGYQATILDLVNKNYLKMKFVKFKEKSSFKNREKPEKKMILIINRKLLNCHKTKVKEYEKSILHSLAALEKNKIIDFEKAEEILNKRTKAGIFQKNYHKWEENLIESSNKILDKYYNKKCSVILRKYGQLAIFFGLISIILFIFSVNIITLLIGFLMLFIGLLFEISPSKNLGGWNKEGKIFKSEWDLVKKYLKKESLIKSHLPQDPSKLNEFLPYAVALGMIKNIDENFKSFPSEFLSYIELYPYFKYSTSNMIKDTVEIGLFRDSSHSAYYHRDYDDKGGNVGGIYGGGSGGGSGGAGGGSGGGGGGAF